jgi:excisionase family DNA binding protein
MDKEEIRELADIITANIIGTTKEVLTSDEAARYMGVSKSYLYKLTMRQQIPHYKPTGKMVYFNRLELENWLQNNRVSTEDEISQQAQAYCMNGSITDKSKPSALPEKGDIIRITSTPERNSMAEVGNTYEVYSSRRQDNGVIYLKLAINGFGIRRQRPFRSTDYTWVIVKRKWS